MSDSGARTPAGSSVVSVTQAVANPAAGADINVAVTAVHGLVAVFAQLVTSATVANRLPALQILDAGANELVSLPASSVQAAGLTETYVWALGMPFASGNNQNLVPLPSGLVVAAGWTIKTVTAAIQAADQWSKVALTFAG